MITKIYTDSGSIYEVEDGVYVTRLSEEPIVDRATHKPMPDKIIYRNTLEWWDDPVIGQRWFFATSDGGRFTTSPVIRITQKDEGHVGRPFERAEQTW